MVRFLEAVFVLSGMIIGVGMFAIPFSFAAAGFWIGVAELFLLSLVVLALHLMYAEIVLVTSEFHRMPGYVRNYLGRGAVAASWGSSLFGIIGALLAYLIVGSLFLQNVVARALPGTSIVGVAAVLAGVAAVITFFPLKKESAINSVLTVFEIAFIALIALFLMERVSLPQLSAVHLNNILMPYGVLLFALSGASVIPDLVTVLGRNRKKVRAAIIVGSLIPAVLYFLFAFAVVGVTGLATSEEAIAGLQRTLGGNIFLWASMAGLLAVFTSLVALSASFQAMLRLDLGMPRRAAWFTASAGPLVLYLAGFQNFIAIISAVGIFAFGVDGILFFLMSRKVQKERGRRSAAVALAGYAILVVIVIGVIAELLRIVW